MARHLTTRKPFERAVPFKEFERMRKEVDRLLDSFFERGSSHGEAREWSPCVDVAETKDQIIVEAEMPGIDSKDIELSISNGRLTIRGEKKREREGEEKDYYVTERGYGAFMRTIELPSAVQSEKTEASYKNGVLRIAIPKSEEAKKKRISIAIEPS